MQCEIRALDPAWHHWLAANPGYEATGPPEQGERGNVYLPVEFVIQTAAFVLSKRALLVRHPDGTIDAPYWRG